MRVSVVIPCLNEAKTIADVVREAKAGLEACGSAVEWSEVVVSDNGSDDGSQALARAAGARIVDAPVRGYGAALHWGTAQSKGDYVLTADADKSHDLMLLPRFVEAMERERADLLLGSRLAGEIRPGAMHFLHRYVGTPALNVAIRLCFGLRTSDCNSGMRMVRREFYRSLGMRCSGMEYSSEILLKTALRRGRYAEIPIHVRPDERGRPPHLRRWRDGWRHLKSIVMLAPNVTVLLPVLLVAIAGAAMWTLHPLVSYSLLWTAYAGLLVGAGIKLVLHVDGVRPSRVIAAMLRSRTAELGMLLTLALVVTGAWSLLHADTVASAAASAFVLAAGGATALGVLYWETARTLLVSHLDAAWESRPDA